MSSSERTGRWIDFKNGYRTMDRDFMESVWWTFKQLFDKGKVYRAFKVRERARSKRPTVEGLGLAGQAPCEDLAGLLFGSKG